MSELPFILLILGPYVVIVFLCCFLMKWFSKIEFSKAIWVSLAAMPVIWGCLAYFNGRKTMTNALMEPILLGLIASTIVAVYTYWLSPKRSIWSAAALCVLGVAAPLLVWFLMPSIQD